MGPPVPLGGAGAGHGVRNAGGVGDPLASIPGAVIQLRSELLSGSAYGCDLGRCQQFFGGPQAGLKQPGMPDRWNPSRNSQVTRIAPSALSGFDGGSSLAPVQEDLLRLKRLPWSAMQGAHKRRVQPTSRESRLADMGVHSRRNCPTAAARSATSSASCR